VPGDVVVVLQQNQHEVFHRDGANLIIEKKILLAEALCGFAFHIKHLDRRTLVVKSDPNVVYKPGDVKAIMNEGMPIRSNPMLRGNLYIKFSIGTSRGVRLRPFLSVVLESVLRCLVFEFLFCTRFNLTRPTRDPLQSSPSLDR
jgi:DnaJ-class molecular chaperone